VKGGKDGDRRTAGTNRVGGPVAGGELEFVSSGIGSYPVTWASRVERPDGRTSPEELLAASHAACYAMALNATLGRANPPERLEVTATVSLDPKEGGGFQVTSSALEAAAWCPPPCPLCQMGGRIHSQSNHHRQT
jgi:OsmC-like protein